MITKEQFLNHPAIKNLSPDDQEYLSREWFKDNVRPTLKGKGRTPDAQQALQDWGIVGKAPAQPSGLGAAFNSGMQQSTPALASMVATNQTPTEYQPNGLMEKIAQGAGFVAGEAPLFAGTALLTDGIGIPEEFATNAALRTALNAGVRGATNFGVQGAANSVARQAATTGSVNPVRVVADAGKNALAGAVVGPLGTVGEAYGPLAKAAMVPVEGAAFTGVNAATDRRMPTLDDLITNTALVAGPHVARAAMGVLRPGSSADTAKSKPPEVPQASSNSPFIDPSFGIPREFYQSQPDSNAIVVTARRPPVEGLSDDDLKNALGRAINMGDKDTARTLAVEAKIRGLLTGNKMQLNPAPSEGDPIQVGGLPDRLMLKAPEPVDSSVARQGYLDTLKQGYQNNLKMLNAIKSKLMLADANPNYGPRITVKNRALLEGKHDEIQGTLADLVQQMMYLEGQSTPPKAAGDEQSRPFDPEQPQAPPAPKPQQAEQQTQDGIVNRLINDEGGQFDPDAMAQGIAQAGSTVRKMGKAINDFSDVALKTSIEASKQLHPVIGEALQKMAAARSESAYLSDKWAKHATKGLDDTQKELLGRFLVHERGVDIAKRDGTPNNVPRLNAIDLNYVKKNPVMQAAIARHLEIQPHIEAMRRYLGMKTFHKTESGTFIRNKRLNEGDAAVHGMDAAGNVLPKGEVRPGFGNGGSVASRGRIKGTNMDRATGMGDAYETDYETLIRHSMDQDMFNMRRKQFLETLQKEGLAIPLVKGDKSPRTIEVNGKEVPTGKIAFRAPHISHDEVTGELIEEGPVKETYAVPKQFEKDYNHLTQERQTDLPNGMPDWYQKTANLATKMQLLVPAEATKHANRVISLLSKNPLAKDDIGYAVKYLVPYLGPRLEAMRQIMDVSALDRPLMDRLARCGAIPLRSIDHIQGHKSFAWMDSMANTLEKIPGYDKAKKIADLPKNSVFDMPDLDATGIGRMYGLDIRSRVAAAKLYLKVKPHASDAELADFANQFGNYTTELQSRVVRRAKDMGATFSGFQSQAIPTEIARTVGNHGMDVSHLPLAKQLALTAGTLVSGTLGTAAMGSLITWARTGKWPWEHAGLKPGDVRISDKGPDGKPVDIDFSSFDPALARASRFLGIRAAMVADKEGRDSQDKGAVFAKEAWRDARNDVYSFAGPMIHDIVRLYGHDLYVNRKDQMQRTVPDYQDLGKQAVSNVGMAAMKTNGVVDAGINAIMPFVGKTIADNPRYPKDPNWNAAMRAWDTISPVNVISGKDDPTAEYQNALHQFQRMKQRYKQANQ